MVLESIEYAHGDARLTGLLGLPDENSGERPGVLVAHAADGIAPGIRQRVEMLAALGYVAFAVDLYGGDHPLSGAAVGEAMMALRTDNDLFRARIRVGFDVLAARPEVDARKTAAIGYCFGGMACLELARSGAPVLGVVSYHGLLTTPAPARPGEMTARVLVCTGAKDPYVPRVDVEAFQDEMIAVDADWNVNIYGRAEHSFAVLGPQAAVDMPGLRYDPSADRQSWAATLAFFDELFAEPARP